jgi:dUTP pyrophosphatase
MRLSWKEHYMRDVKIKLLHPDAKVPTKGTELSAGFDLYCVIDAVFLSGEIRAIPLGFATDIPPELHARIESRSGLALKGMVVLTGVIDADYRGEWKVIMKNLSRGSMSFTKGDRVAQCVLRYTPPAGFAEVSELSDTAREGGFGSTGR